MEIIRIPKEIFYTSHKDLQEELSKLKFDAIKNLDYNDQEKSLEIVDALLKYSIEGLMRIFESKLSERPLQNELYDKVEEIFDQDSAYNINRMISGLRRAKKSGFEKNDDYLSWFKNRIRKGTNKIIDLLNDVYYVKVPTIYLKIPNNNLEYEFN
jgi:hypothetical protein